MRVSKKIILTILSLSLFVFSVSCSNEKTTGGGGGVPPAAPEAPGGGGEGGEESPDTPFTAAEESGNQRDITVKNSTEQTAGTIGFTVTGASDYTVTITKVDKGSSPEGFDIADFEYNKDTKELKLSSDGLKKFENGSFTEEQKNGYTIIFEVADSSDSSRKQSVEVQINLIKAKTVVEFKVAEESGNQRDITVKNSTEQTAGTIGFTVTGASDYTAKISSVTKIDSSPDVFNASDFEYNKTSKELKLSQAGLTKFETSKDQFTEEQKNAYSITFEVADSSDSSRKQDVSVQINLIKAKADAS